MTRTTHDQPTISNVRAAIRNLKAALDAADGAIDAAIATGDSKTFDALLAYFSGCRIFDLELALVEFDPTAMGA